MGIWGINDEDTKLSVKTINFLLEQGKRVLFVTNNSNKRRVDFLKELEQRGIVFAGRSDAEKLGMMVSAAFTTARYLAQQKLTHPFVITSDLGLLDELREIGITEYFATVGADGNPDPRFVGMAMNGDTPSIAEIINGHPHVDSIVVGWDMCITAKKVATAVNYMRWHDDLNKDTLGYTPLPLVTCASDASGVFGTAEHKGKVVKVRAIGNGAMADFVGRCFDPPREAVDMGKPSEALLELLKHPDAYGVDLSKSLMVGDTLQTDIVFGNKGGMDTLLVFTGVTTEAELEADLQMHDPLRVPTFVLPKLGHFVESSPNFEPATLLAPVDHARPHKKRGPL